MLSAVGAPCSYLRVGFDEAVEKRSSPSSLRSSALTRRKSNDSKSWNSGVGQANSLKDAVWSWRCRALKAQTQHAAALCREFADMARMALNVGLHAHHHRSDVTMLRQYLVCIRCRRSIRFIGLQDVGPRKVASYPCLAETADDGAGVARIIEISPAFGGHSFVLSEHWLSNWLRQAIP